MRGAQGWGGQADGLRQRQPKRAAGIGRIADMARIIASHASDPGAVDDSAAGRRHHGCAGQPRRFDFWRDAHHFGEFEIRGAEVADPDDRGAICDRRTRLHDAAADGPRDRTTIERRAGPCAAGQSGQVKTHACRMAAGTRHQPDRAAAAPE